MTLHINQKKIFEIIQNNFYLRSFLLCLNKTNEVNKIRGLIYYIVKLKGNTSPHIFPKIIATSKKCEYLYHGMIRKRYFNEYQHIFNEVYGFIPKSFNFITFTLKMHDYNVNDYINRQINYRDSVMSIFYDKYLKEDFVNIKNLHKNDKISN